MGDDDYVFGDDDFPSAEVADFAAEEVEATEEDAGDVDDPFAMMNGMGAEDSSAPVQVKAVLVAEETPVEATEEDAGDVDDPFAMMGGMGAEDSSAPVQVKAVIVAEETPAEPENAEEGEPYPDIKYGCETPERLTNSKMEKKMKKVWKEGAKRGVEIEGAADMGGLQFFCTTLEEPNGDVDMLYESMKAMNEQSKPDEEERKGGSGRIGKMIISKDQDDSKLAMVAYRPPAKQGILTADVWMKEMLAELGGGELLFGDATTAKAQLSNDPDKGLFVLKLKDSAITLSINYLKKKGLFPDGNDDDDDDYVFGDDDFPSAEVAEAAAEEVEATE